MANTIQIKRGNSAPRNGVLLDGELGFDKANDQLYIGKVDGGSTVNIKVGLKNGVGYNEENQESAIVPLNADTLQGHPASDFRLSNWLPTAAEVGAAPTGYGLGEQAFNAPGNDANQITKCGFFRAYVNTPTGDWWTIQQEDLYGDGKYMIQKASCYGYIHALHAERMVINGSFYEWEWVNPPMILGAEYRTTERWDGKPVYTKLLNFGTATDYATVSLGIAGTCTIIRQEGTLTDAGIVIPYNEFGGSNSFNILTAVNAGEWRCTFRVGSNYSGRFTLALQAWYVKT